LSVVTELQFYNSKVRKGRKTKEVFPRSEGERAWIIRIRSCVGNLMLRTAFAVEKTKSLIRTTSDQALIIKFR